MLTSKILGQLSEIQKSKHMWTTSFSYSIQRYAIFMCAKPLHWENALWTDVVFLGLPDYKVLDNKSMMNNLL